MTDNTVFPQTGDLETLKQLLDELRKKAFEYSVQSRLTTAEHGSGMHEVIEAVREWVRAAPKPTGYRVDVAEDAPDFVNWRQVAWFADEPDFVGFVFQHNRLNHRVTTLHLLPTDMSRADLVDMCRVEGDARFEDSKWIPVFRYRITDLSAQATR